MGHSDTTPTYSPQTLPTAILARIMTNDTFCRTALPHIRSEYFENAHQALYAIVLEFISKYNTLPTPLALDLEFRSSPRAEDRCANDVLDLIQEISRIQPSTTGEDHQWLLDATERWCKDRAIYLAIMESITIIDGKSKDKGEGSIPELLAGALAVSFDTNVGHDYLEDAEKRYEFYHTPHNRIPFALDMFNTITKGGIKRKTLNIILAGCVHPETKVKLRLRKRTPIQNPAS